MNFDSAFTKLLGHEGGYSNNPADPGGATMWGVTEKMARQSGYIGDMQDYPQADAKKLYRQVYWDKCQCTLLPEDLRFNIFDAAVNSGVSQASKWLQQAVGAEQDGVIGPKTIALANISTQNLLAKYLGFRLEFMTNLKTWPDFGKGWARRIATNLKG